MKLKCARSKIITTKNINKIGVVVIVVEEEEEEAL